MAEKIIGYAHNTLLNCSVMSAEKNTSVQRAEFAARLREAMVKEGHAAERDAEHGVSAKALSTAAGVSVETARRYISGRVMPRVEKMTKIATWLGYNLLWLRDGIGPPRGGIASELSPLQHEVMDNMRQLSLPNQEILRDMAKALKAKKN